jgi:GNAT superfamily N-acetyltransferase
MSLDIRLMSPSDLDVALGWARDEGWNPGLDDAAPFYAQDPTGFLMGWLDNEPIGCISVVKYDEHFAFLGLYIVRPRWRGQGYGKAIWDAGIASAGARTIGLDGVVEQQDNYRQSGFALAHRSTRWGGLLGHTAAVSSSVQPVTPELVSAVSLFDRGCFPAPRSAFLAGWLADTPSRHSLVYRDGATVRGYGTIRRCVDGHKIGPLFADTPEVAAELLDALARRVSGPIFIDVPAVNEAAIEIVQSRGLVASFGTARMYRGVPIVLPSVSIFGITSLELG